MNSKISRLPVALREELNRRLSRSYERRLGRARRQYRLGISRYLLARGDSPRPK